jgi:AcrR family transcriptional regulator
VSTAAKLTAKGAATRSRIVEAAADRVLAHGVDGTSLDDIRADTKTSKSQLFHYFPGGKAELVRAIVACQGDRVLAAQRPAIDALDSWDAWGRWRDLVVAHYARVDGVSGCPIGSLASAAAAEDPQLREHLAAYLAAWRDRLAAGIEALRDRGEIDPRADPRALATSLLAAIQGGLVLAQASGELAPLELALDAALDHLRALRSAA